jgi:SAM-dependent methyltransferase
MLESVANLSDDEWLGRLIASLDDKTLGLPGFPAAATQNQFVGRIGDAALNEVAPFYRLVRDQAPLASDAEVLDFGVGWGRIIRFFLRDLPAGQLYGVDIDPVILETCREIGVPGTLSQIAPSGRLPYADGKFGAIYAYSVFSHLSEDAANHWLPEIARCLKPGGLFVFTTTTARFLDMCRAIKEAGVTEGYQGVMARMFLDPAAALASYRAGEFVYSGTGGKGVRDPSFYGWAAVPREYVESRWGEWFAIEDFIDETTRFEQGVFVLRRG